MGNALPASAAPQDYEAFRDALLADPGVHHWVKDIIPRLELRDPVDTLNNLDLLRDLFNARLQGMLAAAAGER